MQATTEKRASLNEVCAPLFLYLTTFRRNAGSSKVSIPELQAALTREFDKVRLQAERDPRLAALLERVRYALVAAADQIVLASTWSQRQLWAMNLLETRMFGRAEGGRKFYRVVDEILADPSDDAAEAAAVLFSCMGLGFQGELLGERKELDSRRQRLFEKARLAGALGKTLSPDAYGRNAQKEMATLPTVATIRLVGVTLVALGFAFLAGRVVTGVFTSQDRADVQRIVDKIDHPDRPTVEIK